MRPDIFCLICLALLLTSVCHAQHYSEAGNVTLKNAAPDPDLSRLPSFCTSDPMYDAFVNSYFMRHLSVDQETAVYWHHPVVGAVDNMWTVEWDAWFLPWIDRGAMGLKRQLGSDRDFILSTIMMTAVDKYGYVWYGHPRPDPNDSVVGYYPTFGWCWPKYNRNTTVARPTGWEFIGKTDEFRKEISARDIELQAEYVDHRLAGKITGPHPEIISPKFDVDVFQVPIIELDIEYRIAEADASKLVNGVKVYWTTDKSPRFSEDRMVSIDFAALPPGQFPQYYAPWVGKTSARYSLYFPMYLHPEWGRDGRRITRLKVVPTGPDGQGAEIHVNYIRASYDLRSSVTNGELINSTYRMFMWSGDEALLRSAMPKLRRAMLFMNNHLRGRQDHLLNFGWYVGHDGLGGGDNVGRGLIGSYWDLLPSGHYDLESSTLYYYALRAMAQLERAVSKRGISVPEVSVVGPDNKTTITYKETAKSLDALADKVKKKIERAFWIAETGRFCRNIDVNGKKHDYGFLHANLQAMMFGLGTEEQRASVLSWLDGRKIEGDTSTGADIYRWRFAPRTTTRDNEDFYFWPWVHDRNANQTGPYAGYFKWGDQMQDGGGVPFTSLFDLCTRVRTGDQKQIDRAFQRTLEIKRWYEDVSTAGGKGTEFYRAYYKDHPERGIQQSPTPGGLGLDREFLGDASLGTLFLLYAFLGIDATEDGVLTVSPALPTRLDKIGVNNIFYHGNYLNIEAGRSYVSFEGSRITNSSGLRARVKLRKPAGEFGVCVDGKRAKEYVITPDGFVTVGADLGTVRIETLPSRAPIE